MARTLVERQGEWVEDGETALARPSTALASGQQGFLLDCDAIARVVNAEKAAQRAQIDATIERCKALLREFIYPIAPLMAEAIRKRANEKQTTLVEFRGLGFFWNTGDPLYAEWERLLRVLSEHWPQREIDDYKDSIYKEALALVVPAEAISYDPKGREAWHPVSIDLDYKGTAAREAAEAAEREARKRAQVSRFPRR